MLSIKYNQTLSVRDSCPPQAEHDALLRGVPMCTRAKQINNKQLVSAELTPKQTYQCQPDMLKTSVVYNERQIQNRMQIIYGFIGI